MDKLAKSRMAPYVSAVALQKFLQRIKNRNMPQEIDEGLLQDFGIPKGDIYALISALKFLGVIDERARLTEDFALLQTTEEEFRQNLSLLTRRVYSIAFTRLDLRQDSREQIRNFFARNYSNSQADKATSLFLFLCKESGIPLGEQLTAKGVRAREKPQQIRPKPRWSPSQQISSEIRQPEFNKEKEVPVPVPSPEIRREAISLQEQYVHKLIESELSITIAPGVDAETLREAREILQTRHKLVKEMLREIERKCSLG